MTGLVSVAVPAGAGGVGRNNMLYFTRGSLHTNICFVEGASQTIKKLGKPGICDITQTFFFILRCAIIILALKLFGFLKIKCNYIDSCKVLSLKRGCTQNKFFFENLLFPSYIWTFVMRIKQNKLGLSCAKLKIVALKIEVNKIL